MKKEHIFRKIIISSLLGLPIGITLLMINYASIYLIAGENVFKTEITQLQDIKTLVLQLIIVGCAYYLFFILVSLIARLNKTKSVSDKFIVEHPYKSVLIMLLIMIITIFILALLNFKIFTENISMMNIISFLIILIISGVCLCIKSTIESDWVKKINEKLKERNK